MENKERPMIRLERFEKLYGKIRAVYPLDLEVRHGESFALLGPNGSGKTTIIRALVGLHAPTGGRVLINGEDIVKAPDRVKRNLVYVPQRVILPDPFTVREVVEMFARLNGVEDHRVDEALALFVLEEAAVRPIRELSGGMLQRLGLAVAFLRRAPLLVLDEPTLNLDPLGIERLRKHLKSLKEENTTLFFSSHLLPHALHLADRVGVLVGGRMVAVDRVEEFRAAVSRRTTVRVVMIESLNNRRIADVCREAGADWSDYNGRHVWFNAPPGRRLEVIRAIESAGGVIEEFHTENPDWESLIRDQFETNGAEPLCN